MSKTRAISTLGAARAQPKAKRDNSKTADAPVKPHRPTEAEKTQRIDAIIELLVIGTRRSEILEFARVQWGIGRAQSDNYIAEATALIKSTADKTREQAFAEHVAFRQQVRRRAMDGGDLRVALESAKDEAKLRDLYPDARVKVTDWKSEFITLLRNGDVTPEQVIEVLGDDAAEIIAAAGMGKNVSAGTGTIPPGADSRASGTESPSPEQAAVS